MTLSFRPLNLPCEFEFQISRNIKIAANTVLVTLTRDGIAGTGEAVPCAYYGETQDSVLAFYTQLQQNHFFEARDLWTIQAIEMALSEYPGNRAAKAGINLALYDWAGKQLGVPLYRLWGLDPGQMPETSYTLGIADEETMKRKIRVAMDRGYTILKVKLGTPKDMETLQLIRGMVPQTTRLRVDANAAWDLQSALEMVQRLSFFDVEFVEEPLLLDSPEEAYACLKQSSPLPLMADESLHTSQDVPRVAERFHMGNIKLTKTGGLTEAMRTLHALKAHGMPVMLGCFCESSVSITAFAHMAPMADFADLDGSLLLAQDPFEGVLFSGSKMTLPDRPGIGCISHAGNG